MTEIALIHALKALLIIMHLFFHLLFKQKNVQSETNNSIRPKINKRTTYSLHDKNLYKPSAEFTT